MENFSSALEDYPVWQTGLPALAGHATYHACKRDQIKMRSYMDRRTSPSKGLTSPTWVPPPPCQQALSLGIG